MDTIEAYICMDAPSAEAAQKVLLTSYSQFRKSWYMLFFQAPFLPEFMQRIFDFNVFNIIYKSDAITKDDIEAYKYVFSKRGAQTGPINYYRANIVNIVLGKYSLPRLEKYAPGLYLHGERDLYVSDVFVQVLENMYPNLEGKLIPEASHFAQQDKPEAVNRLMREFLKSKRK